MTGRLKIVIDDVEIVPVETIDKFIKILTDLKAVRATVQS